MKRLLCFILILVMAFGATAPVFAESWTPNQAITVTSNTGTIASYLANFSTHFTDWFGVGANTSGNSNTWNAFYTRWLVFQNDFENLVSWLVPDGPNSNNTATMLDAMIVLSTYAMNHLPDISVIAGVVSNWMTSNISRLTDLDISMTNYFRDASTVNVANRKLNMHSDLVNSALTYPIRELTSGFGYTETRYSWLNGSPIGNLALILDKFNNNYVLGAQMNYDRWFEDADASTVLSVWDSQGDSLEQVTWRPESGLNGLHKYLAYLQRDVARMTFIIADPHEQAGMENANDSGVSAMYADVYDADNGGVTLDDLSDTFNTQKVAKQTFDTGVSFSTNGLFSFTDDGNWGFWSNAVKNDMDNVPMTRKSESFDSTAYDEQFEELSSIWGVKDGK